MTAQEIAYATALSDRTVRKYIGLINEDISEHDAVIEAKRGHGFQLFFKDADRLKKYFKDIDNPLNPEVNAHQLQVIENRQYSILKKLLLEGDHAFIDDLAENLFVSRSTISNELVEIKAKLKPYHLKIESKPNIGLYVVGEEQAKRHFIMDYFFMDRLKDNLSAFSTYTSILENVNIAEILMIVLDECRENELHLSDFVMYNIVLHIGLAIKRIKAGFKMDRINKSIQKNSIQYQTAIRIVNRISESLDIEFPEVEADYIALHLSNKVASSIQSADSQYSKSEVEQQLIEALNQMDKVTSMSMAKDQILIDGLMTHFQLMFVHLKNRTQQLNPLLDEIKEKHNQVLEWVVNYIGNMPVFSQYQVTESEWAYIAIHVLAAIERFMNRQKVHVLVICATGLGSAQMLKMRLENEFGNKMVINDVISYYEITDEKLKGIDLVVTSIHLANVVFNVPIIQVSVFLNADEIQRINAAISQYKGLQVIQNTPQLQEYHLKDTFHTLFRRDLFFYSNQPMTKEEVLGQMIQKVEELENRPISVELNTQLDLRESFSSVAFSDYLAVPHPVDGVTNSAYVAVSIVPQKVEWDDNHQDIQIIFLLLPDRFQNSGIAVVSQSLTRIIENDEFRQSLIQCETFEEFSDVFVQVLSEN